VVGHGPTLERTGDLGEGRVQPEAPQPGPRAGTGLSAYDEGQAFTSYRSLSITLTHAATKSCTNFSCDPSWA
jgi:hypothetical protein